MKWSDVREEFPEERLSLMSPGTASGTFDYFSEERIGDFSKNIAEETGFYVGAKIIKPKKMKKKLLP